MKWRDGLMQISVVKNNELKGLKVGVFKILSPFYLTAVICKKYILL